MTARPAAPADRRVEARRRLLDRVQPSTLSWIALAALLIVGAGALYHLTRGTTFWFDEWVWVLSRRGNDAGTFLRSYNGHFSLIPIAIYRLLFATAGLGDYRPYRLVLIALHLICVGLVFAYARRRVGDFLALCAAALILSLGPAWQDILWPFQMGWLISVSSGLGALLMLDRRDRLGDIAACVLLAVSLASSGVGLVIALGLVVDVLWGRRRWRDSWILAVPLVLYGAWWLSYQHTNRLSPIRLVPRFAANEAAAAFGALVGANPPRANGSPFPSGGLLTWGRPIAGIAAGLLIWRLIRRRHVPVRVLTLLTMLMSFWFVTALTRGAFLHGSQAWSSRYLYVSALLILVVISELLRDVSISPLAKVVVGAAVAAAAISNIGALREAAAVLRTVGQSTRADLGALEIERHFVKPNYVAGYLPGTPLIRLQAGPYFAAATALGTPAFSPAQIEHSPESVRLVADLELIRIHHLALPVPPSHPSLGARPLLDRAEGGALKTRGACFTLRRPRGAGASSNGRLEVGLPSAGVLVTARGGPVSLGVRRFADDFVTLGTVSSSTRVRIPPDLSTQPWHVGVVPAASVTVCGLR